jgi:hypothetical protein
MSFCGSLRTRSRSVMSLAIVDAPITSPMSFLRGDRLKEMLIFWPSFLSRIVS